MHAIERSRQIDGHHVVPSIGGEHIKIALGCVGARAVDQDVNAVVLRNYLLRSCKHSVLIGHIQQNNLRAAQGLQCGQGACVGSGRPARDHDMRAGLDKLDRRGQTNAAGAARDPSNLTFQLCVHGMCIS